MATNTLDSFIEKSSGIVGGKPRISGRRITVQNIAIWHEWMGWSADEIAVEYDLSLTEIYAALAYYHNNSSEINLSIKNDEAFVEELKKQNPSKLPFKLNES